MFHKLWPTLKPITPVGPEMLHFLSKKPSLYLLPNSTEAVDKGFLIGKETISFDQMFAAATPSKLYVTAIRGRSDFLASYVQPLTRWDASKSCKKITPASHVSRSRLLVEWMSDPTWEIRGEEGDFKFSTQGSLTQDDVLLRNTLRQSEHPPAQVRPWLRLACPEESGEEVLSFLQAPLLSEVAHRVTGVQQEITSPLSTEKRNNEFQARQRSLSLLTGVTSLGFIKESLLKLLPDVPEAEGLRSSLRQIAQFAESTAASQLPLLQWHLSATSALRKELRTLATSNIQDPDIREALRTSPLSAPDLFGTQGVARVQEALLKPAPRTVNLKKGRPLGNRYAPILSKSWYLPRREPFQAPVQGNRVPEVSSYFQAQGRKFFRGSGTQSQNFQRPSSSRGRGLPSTFKSSRGSRNGSSYRGSSRGRGGLFSTAHSKRGSSTAEATGRFGDRTSQI